MAHPFKCGFVTILGKPNVGKSTLLNGILQQKISITSRKSQTTRYHILGIKTDSKSQIIYVDTPGILEKPSGAMNRYMNRLAMGAVDNMDLIAYMIDRLSWTERDDSIVSKILKKNGNVLLVVNKIDKLTDKKLLLPFINNLKTKTQFREILPISALSRNDIQLFENTVVKYLPEGAPVYPDDQVTDKTERFIAAEFIREKLMRRLGDELPYQTCVTIDKFEADNKLIRISAIIWVASASQKAIVIGEKGRVLKSIGTEARTDMEKFFDKQVYLNTWVKVREKWMDDIKALEEFGYQER